MLLCFLKRTPASKCKILLILKLFLFLSKPNSCVPSHSSDMNMRNIVGTMQLVTESILYHCNTTEEIANIIICFKSLNSFGNGKVPTKLLKLCSHFISSPLNYICNGTHFTGVFPDRLKYAIIRPLFKEGTKNGMFNYKPISILTSFQKFLEK